MIQLWRTEGRASHSCPERGVFARERVQLRLRLLGVLFLIGSVVWQPAQSQAAEVPFASVPRGNGVVVLLDPLWPNLASLSARKAAPSSLTVTGVPQSRVEISDPSFLESLQSAIILERARKTFPELSACQTATRGFSELVTELENDLLWLRLEKAARGATEAWKALGCINRVVTAAELAHFQFLTGLLAFYTDQDPRPSFAEALAILPSLVEKDDYGSPVWSAFLAAQEGMGSRERVVVTPNSSQTRGFELWLDGQLVATSPMTVPNGKHLVQLRVPGGPVLASWILVASRDAGASMPLLPAPLSIPSSDELRTALRVAVTTRAATPELLAAISTLLMAADQPWMGLVMAGEKRREARALLILSNGDQTSSDARCTVPPFCEARNQGLTLVTRGLALTAGAGAGVWSYTVLRDEFGEDPGSLGEARGLVLARNIGGTAALACLTGTLALLSYNWHVPADFYSHGQGVLSATIVPTIQWHPTQQAMGLSLAVQW